MARVFKKGIPLTIAWTLTKPDGSSFDLAGYGHRLFYGVGNRYTQVSGTAVTGNVVSWTFPASEQRTAEDYSLKLMLYQNSRLFTTLVYNKAFSFLNGAIAGEREEQQNETASLVHLYSAVEFYLFQPVVPTVGDDGYWYANGAKVVDADGNNVLADHTLDYDEEANTLIIDRGRVDASGNPIQQVVPLQVGIESVAQVQTSSDPSGVNKVRVTLTNGYTSDFVVTNGVGITGITENLSPNDGGTNDIVITFSNGQSATVHTKNGSRGNSGYTGAAGELEVVNNLVDGGATAALAAQQGKVLNGKMQDVSVFVKGLAQNVNTGFINSSNEWKEEQGSGVCVYVKGVSTVTMSRETIEGIAYFAFLKSNVYETGILEFCTDTTRLTYTNDEPIEVPSDCNYLWLMKSGISAEYDFEGFTLQLDGHGVGSGFTLFDAVDEIMDNSKSYSLTLDNESGSQKTFSSSIFTAGKTYYIHIDSWNALNVAASDVALRVTCAVGGVSRYLVKENGGLNYAGKTFRVEFPSGATNLIMGGRGTGTAAIRVYDADAPSLNLFQFMLEGGGSQDPEDVFELDSKLKDAKRFSDRDVFDMESHWFVLGEYLEDKYWNSEKAVVNAFINKFRARAGSGRYQIGIISDTHGSGNYTYRGNNNTIYASCLRPIAVFNKVVGYCDAAIHGGDISVDYGNSRSRNLAFIKSVLRKFRFNKPFFITKGNHDENNDQYVEADMLHLDWDNNIYYNRGYHNFTAVTENSWTGDDLYVQATELVSDTEFRNMAQHWLCPTVATWGPGAYYFYDIPDLKMRVIVANSFPVLDTYLVDDVEEYLWFAQTALNLSSKSSDAANWQVLVLRHTQSTGIVALSDCLNAFRNGTSWTYSGTTVNFGTMNGGGITLIAHVHGHEHMNCFSNGAGYFDIGEAAGFTSALGSADSYGISVWTIDTVNKKIYEDTIDGKTWVYNYAAASGRLEIKRGDSFTAAKSGVSGTMTVSCSEPTILISGQSVTIGNSTPLGNYTVTVTGSTSGSYNYLIKVVESYS